jgi:hypothetical protein
MKRLAILATVVLLHAHPFAQGIPSATTQPDAIGRLLLRLEQAIGSGRADDFRAIALPSISQGLVDRFATGSAGPARAVVRERLRRPKGAGYDIVADVLVSEDVRGRVAQWLINAAPDDAAGDQFRITSLRELAAVDNLLRLRLDTSQQFDVKDLKINAPDLTITMASGSAFLVRTPAGITGLVLRGKGEAIFTPAAPAEQLQLRIFSLRSIFRTDVDTLFVRLNPAEVTQRITTNNLIPVATNPEEVVRAQQVFDEYAPKTYNLDLQLLTNERWSLEPPTRGLVVEFHTRRHGWLTYTRSPSEIEDISLFDRPGRRVICQYSSATETGVRPADFDDSDASAFDVEHYSMDLTFDPARLWISGRGSLTVRITDARATTMTFKLAQSFAVSSVTSPEFGELLALRVIGQNNLLVGLPAPAPRGTRFTFEVTYAGRLPPQGEDREALQVQAQSQSQEETLIVTPEPRFLYSNHIQWYPQAVVTDYATAWMRLTVPLEYQIVASGYAQTSSTMAAAAPGQSGSRTTVFVADRPVRYLSCVISKFQPVGRSTADVPMVAAAPGSEAAPPVTVNIDVQSTPRMVSRNRQTPARTAAMMQFYAKTIGEAPYPNLTLAILDDNLPGGHSPAYFIALHQALPTTPYTWSADPVSFENQYPLFFLAHETAHQWWGQAVGWRNYHDQWLSEGLAQYFAVLYAAEDRGPALLQALIGTMRNTSQPVLNQGPISLGFRIGHLSNDTRTLRSILYNKAAVVLHMLRRFIGDDAFFRGLRKFYGDWRFKKAGADQLQAAFEETSGVKLDRFFEGWIRGFHQPRVALTWKAGTAEAPGTIRVEQDGEIFDFPLTVTLQFADGKTEERTLRVTGPVFDEIVNSPSPLRKVTIHDPLSYFTTR